MPVDLIGRTEKSRVLDAAPDYDTLAMLWTSPRRELPPENFQSSQKTCRRPREK